MKTIRFGILMFAVLASAMSFAAARDGKKSSAANAAAAKIEEWKREVKKLEAAPVAEGFVKWTGLDTIKGTKNARWLSPSDLRGRFVVIVELDKEKVVEQFKAASQLQRLGFVPAWDRDWDFTTVDRDVVVVYNVHDLSDEDLAQKIYGNETFKLVAVEQQGYNFYGNITFEGAPDSATERPYVYVMAPEGKEPIYKSRIVQGKTQCVREAKEAIAKAAAMASFAGIDLSGPGEAVSHVPEFILLTTEVKGCRDNAGGPDSTYGSGKAHPASHEAVKAGDEFVVDYVRVYNLVR